MKYLLPLVAAVVLTACSSHADKRIEENKRYIAETIAAADSEDNANLKVNLAEGLRKIKTLTAANADQFNQFEYADLVLNGDTCHDATMKAQAAELRPYVQRLQVMKFPGVRKKYAAEYVKVTTRATGAKNEVLVCIAPYFADKSEAQEDFKTKLKQLKTWRFKEARYAASDNAATYTSFDVKSYDDDRIIPE